MPSRLTILAAIVVVSMIACTSSGSDLAADHEALLRLHHQQRQAHLEHKADLLTASFADTFYSIGRGQVTMPTREASTQRLQAYFDRSSFLEWDDIVPPLIRISPDGMMAYVIVQKRVRLIAADSVQSPEVEHTVFAWLSTYEKQNGTWRMTSVVSTDRPGEPTRGS